MNKTNILITSVFSLSLVFLPLCNFAKSDGISAGQVLGMDGINNGGTANSGPSITGALLLEDGVSILLLEDGTSSLCLESGC